jgi:hypothetical protein
MDVNITYDVRLYKTDVWHGKKVTTYTVRWKTGNVAPWKEPFRTTAQAESFRSALMTAARSGEAFRLDTGRPVSWGRQEDTISWYDFCVAYVDMKWKHSAAKRRATIAWALVTVTPPMLATAKGAPEPKKMRRALRQWGFNTARRSEAPEDAEAILRWLSRNTRPVSALTDPDVMRSVLDTAGTLLDGKPAAAWTQCHLACFGRAFDLWFLQVDEHDRGWRVVPCSVVVGFLDAVGVVPGPFNNPRVGALAPLVEVTGGGDLGLDLVQGAAGAVRGEKPGRRPGGGRRGWSAWASPGRGRCRRQSRRCRSGR